MFRHWRRRRKSAKVEHGDGTPLQPFRFWHLFYRSLFVTEHPNDDDQVHTYAVDVNFFDEKSRAFLYRDGTQHAVSKMPAAFPISGGFIEVAATMFGMKRVHLVLNSGEERQLRPAPRTAEHRRAVFGQRFPGMSRLIAGTAIVILLIGLVVGVPQLIEQVSQIPIIAERFGSFSAPFSPPGWVNTTLLVGGIAAAFERALTLRNHWLIDADTWLFGD